jgi:sterol 3beta-glucosyltransferase
VRITILANGSRGDVQPYVALGIGLRAAGYDVTVAAPTPFREFVTARGLAFADLEADPRAIVESELGQSWLEAGHNPFAFVRRLKPILEPTIDQFLAASLRACEGADAIVYSPFGVVGWQIGEAMRVPAILASPVPATSTTAFASPIVPPLPLGGIYNRLTWSLVNQLFWQPFRRQTNRWRTDTLGLPPLPFSGPFRRITGTGEMVLGEYSRHVVPRPPDWPVWVQVTGYWFLDRPDAWRPPREVVDFLSAGPPPVYVGLGSMAGRDPAALTDLVLAALRRTRRRGILLSGWGGLGQADVGDDVCVVRDIPHDWLFPQVSAVVHHGGAGTTGAGLRAGRPSVLLPFFADQPFWGQRVHHLGVGPRPIPQKRLTVEALAAAIHAATTDPFMAERARKLGERIRSEDGVGVAVGLLQRQLDA